MSKVYMAFKPCDKHTPDKIRNDEADDLIGYQVITHRIIFDVFMNFILKAHFAVNGATMYLIPMLLQKTVSNCFS